ncbi:MAG: hypothetical protein ACU88J_10790, partial [Gammaproteobacteria bacterium]
LIDAFGITKNPNYSRITELTDRKVGFSIQRNYPNDILFIPLVSKNGEVDSVALIHVVYSHPSKDSPEFNSLKVPLIVRITNHSRYLSNHIDYDFEDPESPTRESIERTKSTPTPLELDYYEEYFYDHHAKTFLAKDHEPLTGEKLLDRVFDAHCSTSHKTKGKGIRRKLWFQDWVVGVLAAIISLFKWLLIYLFGRTVDDSEKYFAYLEGYDRKSFKKLSTESLDVFGYKASRAVIILFCVLISVLYATTYFNCYHPPYLESIFKNNFLALTHSLLMLWILDVVIPEVLFQLINLVTKVRTKIAFKKFI